MTDAVDVERSHQDAWYRRAIRERFFEREGFRRLTAWNLARLRRVVPLTSSSRVLSLGCGTGEYELLLAPAVGRLVGVDLSPVAIDEARRRAAERRVANAEFVTGSLLAIDWPAASFDVVYALGVLHHLSHAERRALLRRVRGWLAPGGWFYARDPNARGVLRVAAACFRDPTFHSPNEAALHPDALARELAGAGFARPAIGYTDVLAGPLPWLLASSSRLLWTAVFGLDRAWLAVPGLRQLASQFDVRARR